MKTPRYTILFITLIMALVSASAQSVKLSAPEQAVQGQNFQISIQVKDIQGSAPAAPRIENCTLRYGPATQTMVQTQIVNGAQHTSAMYTYTYTYSADKASTVSIPPITMTAQNGQQYTTKGAKLTILPPDKNAPQQQGRPSHGGMVQTDPFADFKPDDMFVRINLSRSQVYEQQPVVATVKIYTLYDISEFRVITQPTFEGFLSEELDVPYHVEREHINGRNYYSVVLKRCILYPQETGTLKINSGKYEVTLLGWRIVNAGYFPMQERVQHKMNTQSNTASLKVVPLPTPKPAGFEGAVGSFTATTDLTPTELRTNESATYTLTISGTGNIKYLQTPKLQLPLGIEQYTPQTDIDTKYSNGDISGTYTITYTLVPQEPGDFTIPGRSYVYFDPSDSKYHSIDIPDYSIKVAKGINTVTTEQKAIVQGMTDIHHIKPCTQPLALNHRPVFTTTLYWCLYAVSALALIIVAFAYRRNLRKRADVGQRRQTRAAKVASKRLRAARQAMESGSSDKFYSELAKALFGYIGDKLGIPSSQLIRENISSELTQRGIDESASADIISILDECEMARFTPQHTDTEMSQLYRQAVDTIKKIENTKPAKK